MILASRDLGKLDEKWKVNRPFEEIVCYENEGAGSGELVWGLMLYGVVEGRGLEYRRGDRVCWGGGLWDGMGWTGGVGWEGCWGEDGGKDGGWREDGG